MAVRWTVAEAVRDNAALGRFESGTDGAGGFVDYRRVGSTLFLNHAEVPPARGGKGVGTRLVLATLDLIRQRGEGVVAVCPFIQAVIRRHPEYQDLQAR